jgi:hypothetical protein
MHALHAIVSAVTTAPDYGSLLTPVADGATAAITAVLPIAIPVLVALAGLTIGLKVFGKFGVRR